MCGIAGILNFDGKHVEASIIKRMTDSMAHRGPDSEGCWVDSQIGLGHRRLSIIDLSDDGKQPMKEASGNCVITYNGEIYNYRELARDLQAKGYELRTHSDTEVILGLYVIYGVDCVQYLRGMFAFAIWDPARKRLFAARDRVGIKPLYYLRSNEQFVFASEIKAITATGYSRLQVDPAGLCGYLRFLVVPQPQTIFRDIHKLEPGHSMLITAGGDTRITKYWDVQDYLRRGDDKDEPACISGLDSLLNESIRYHMIADVPVSAFLSGGLDSSAVVSLMRENFPDHDIETFSTAFPGQPDFDEDIYARKVSELKGTSHSANEFNEKFLEDYRDIVWYLDEPFAVSSAYATYFLAASAARKTKVVLTGDGGDELFAGYEGYKNDAYLAGGSVPRRFYQLSYNTLVAMRKHFGLKSQSLNRITTGLLRRTGSEGLRYSDQISQSSLYAASQVLDDEVLTGCLDRWQENLVAKYYDSAVSTDILGRKLYAEFKTRLVDEMLMKVDRMTMAHSLEARVPILDHHIVQFAFQLPSSSKLHVNGDNKTTKYLLKRTMEKYLPRDIIYRKKQGFNIPVRTWMEGMFADDVADRLRNGYLVRSGLIRREGLDRVFKIRRRGLHSYDNLLMLLLAADVWMEANDNNGRKVVMC